MRTKGFTTPENKTAPTHRAQVRDARPGASKGKVQSFAVNHPKPPVVAKLEPKLIKLDAKKRGRTDESELGWMDTIAVEESPRMKGAGVQ